MHPGAGLRPERPRGQHAEGQGRGGDPARDGYNLFAAVSYQRDRALKAIDREFANSLAETLTETEKAFQLGFVAMSDRRYRVLAQRDELAQQLERPKLGN